MNILSPYDQSPEFYQNDNRKFRTNNPITKETLTKKHQAIFQNCSLKNKSVVDLGACIGASGKWVLQHGASSYTGVEIQQEYAQKASIYLAEYGTKAQIECTSIENFLDNGKQKFDFVLVLAVLHVFVNFTELLKKIASKTREYLIIENLYPQSAGSIVEFNSQQRINLAGDAHQSMQGVGVRISPSALDLILMTYGFIKDQSIKVAHITNSKDVYNNPTLDESRYIVRYKRNNYSTKNLSEDLGDEQKGRKFSWNSQQNILDTKNYSHNQNIPNFSDILQKTLHITEKTCKPDSEIIDLSGTLLNELLNRGFKCLYSIEDKHIQKQHHIGMVGADRFNRYMGTFQLVIANWVIVDSHKRWIKEIYHSLKENGILILSTQIHTSAMIESLYLEKKNSSDCKNGPVEMKKKPLTKPLDWYLCELKEQGFKSVDIIDSCYSWITFLATK